MVILKNTKFLSCYYKNTTISFEFPKITNIQCQNDSKKNFNEENLNPKL